MDLYTKPGSKIRFTGKGGYDGDKSHASRYLQVGHLYTVSDIDVGQWRSSVYLEEVSTTGFNTVMFENIAEENESEADDEAQSTLVKQLIEQRDEAWAALRWIYRNGVKPTTYRPGLVSKALSDAFGPVRAGMVDYSGNSEDQL